MGVIDEHGYTVVCSDYVFNVSDQLVEFYNDIRGKKLVAEEVLKARKEELDVLKQHQVYKKVPVKRAWDDWQEAHRNSLD